MDNPRTTDHVHHKSLRGSSIKTLLLMAVLALLALAPEPTGECELPMQRVDPFEVYDELKPGDFWWRETGWKLGEPRSAHLLVLIPPGPGIVAAYEVVWAPVSITGNNTVSDRLWNGSFDKPTVGGSWGIEHFHFWITDGCMTLAGP